VISTPVTLSFAPTTNSSIRITSSTITKPDELPPNCGIPPERADLTSADASVTAWFAYTGGHAGENATLTWLDPQGSTYTRSILGAQPSEGGTWCWWWTLPVNGTRLATTLGEWTVRIDWNNTRQLTMPFRVNP